MKSVVQIIVCFCLALIALGASASAQIAPPRPVKGACKDSCVFIPGASQLSRHCPNPAPTCALGQCQCMDVLGEAKWNGQEWRGAFHECYCLPPGSNLGPEDRFLWWHCYYEWKVTKRSSLIASTQHTFDFVADGSSFVHYFNLTDRAEDGTLAESEVLFDLVHGFSGTIVFEELGVGTANPNEELWRVKSVSGEIGSAPLLSYFTGQNRVELRSGSPDIVVYDSALQTIRSVVDIECRLTNRMYPSGVSFAAEISMENRGSHWKAVGRGRVGLPPTLRHTYDATMGQLTLEVLSGPPNSWVALCGASSCLGDVDSDRKVTDADIALVANSVGVYSFGGESPADVNFDAVVDDIDIEIVKQQLGCSDLGSTAIPGCAYQTDISVEQIQVLVTDSSGYSSFTLPAGGAGNNAFYFQLVDLSSCETSNLVRVITH